MEVELVPPKPLENQIQIVLGKSELRAIRNDLMSLHSANQSLASSEFLKMTFRFC
jgi:hypothetical protein